MNKRTEPVSVLTTEQKQYHENVESIAHNLRILSDAVAVVLKGPLKRRTILVLLANASGHSQKTVDAILKAMENIPGDWLSK